MAYSSSYRFENPFGMSVTPWVKRLLVANAAVGAIDLLLTASGQGGVLWKAMAFEPAAVLSRPWTPLTYMFVHAGFFHFLFNMLTLFFFGPPLEERWGSREFLKFYLVAGLGGALLSIATPHASIGGASGAVYGVMLAYAMYWPDNPVYIWGIFPVKVKWLVLALAAISAFGALASYGSGVAHWAHLGGFVTAFLYLRSPWGPSPWGAVPSSARRKKPRGGGFPASLPGLGRKKSEAPKPQKAPGATIRPPDEQQLLDDVDRILEKISARGLGSLTEEERKRLDEVSRRYRSN